MLSKDSKKLYSFNIYAEKSVVKFVLLVKSWVIGLEYFTVDHGRFSVNIQNLSVKLFPDRLWMSPDDDNEIVRRDLLVTKCTI